MIDKIKMIGFVLVFGVLWSSALVAVDTWTGPRIEKYLREKTQKKVLEALVIPYEIETLQEVFTQNVTSEEIDGTTLYRAEDGSVAMGFVGAGSQGPISGIVALGPSLETLRGITIIKHSETPGLGSRVLDADNLANFRDKKVVPELLIVPSGTASADNEVDAITGATLTGDALERILNNSAKQTKALIGQ